LDLFTGEIKVFTCFSNPLAMGDGIFDTASGSVVLYDSVELEKIYRVRL